MTARPTATIDAKPACHPAAPASAVVLLYHRIGRLTTDPFWLSVRPRYFSEHLRVLNERCDVVPLRELHAAFESRRLARPAAAVTFDDGYANNFTRALPILKRYCSPATVFVASGLVGTQQEIWSDELERILLRTPRLPREIRITIDGASRHWSLGNAAAYPWLRRVRHRRWRAWNPDPPTPRHRMHQELWKLLHPLNQREQADAIRQLQALCGIRPQARRTHRWLSPAELRSLAASPLIEIGAHTVNHVSLGHQPPQVQRGEIEESRRQLQELTGQDVGSFSYPFGMRDDFDDCSKRLVRDAGFDRACSNYGGVLSDALDPYDIPRCVVQDWPADEFARRLDRWLGR